ncbi:hypothetical protein ACFQX6_51910 [Streptosporangium lutulentum]
MVYARPGGPPLGVLPTTQLDDPTWVPVVQRLPGWDRILLPSWPNRSTGWIYTQDGGLRGAYSTYRVRIELAARRITVFDAERRSDPGRWPWARPAHPPRGDGPSCSPP